uniref:Uncharacterized protein n=1 Tax=Anguilla anguilla TaxID=7936 RepID=A0A0E9W0J9_ANGAN
MCEPATFDQRLATGDQNETNNLQSSYNFTKKQHLHHHLSQTTFVCL